ncbi:MULTISPECIES: hypothetical protein [Mycobacteriaceae]|uniref:hypothetical protein n=1 Tax=Mycobacteriaceae TaxID=1762 RepID=UPI0032D5A519
MTHADTVLTQGIIGWHSANLERSDAPASRTGSLDAGRTWRRVVNRLHGHMRRGLPVRSTFIDLRAEYDRVEHVFRLYRNGDRYCAIVVRFLAEVASFQVENDTLVVCAEDGSAARFDADGCRLAA